MASPFASLTTSDPIPLPFDEGQWIKVRKLTGAEYDDAQVKHREGFVASDKWAWFFREAVGKKGPTSAAIKKALADPLTGFDRYALVRSGLVAWSYEREKADAIADLDDDAIDFIARAVLRITKPLLFDTPDAEGAQVKD